MIVWNCDSEISANTCSGPKPRRRTRARRKMGDRGCDEDGIVREWYKRQWGKRLETTVVDLVDATPKASVCRFVRAADKRLRYGLGAEWKRLRLR